MKRAYIIRKASRVDIGLGVHFRIDFLWLANIGGDRSALIQADAWDVRGCDLLLLTLLVAHLVVKAWNRDTDFLNLCWVFFTIAN